MIISCVNSKDLVQGKVKLTKAIIVCLNSEQSKKQLKQKTFSIQLLSCISVTKVLKL